MDPWSDPLGINFQLIQSLIAVGSGGPLGTGLMAGIQKLYYLPEAHTDFIFAVAGEELGLLGHGADPRVLRGDGLARAPHVAARAGPVRIAPRARAHDDGRCFRRS